MAANKLQWRRIAKGDKLPCQSFLRKKNGEILKLSTGAGVTVGQDAYYLPVDDVINVIKDYPVEESEDGKIRKALVEMVHDTVGDSLWVDYNVHKEDAIAWLEEQGEHANFRNKIQIGDKVTRNEDGVLVNLSQLNRVAKKDEKQGKQKHQYISRPRYIGEEELLGEQKSAEWSEEDKENLYHVDALIKDSSLEVRRQEYLSNWLKSLRPRSQWKPSDEQMEHLSRAFNGGVFKTSLLMELYQDLKKLKD